MNEQTNLLLSFALFRKLYDAKQDIYEIIKLLINHELSNNTVTKFSSTDMTCKINSKYGFNIPQAVIKTTLNKIKRSKKLELKDGEYLILKTFKPVTEISESNPNINIYIINILSEYINQTKKISTDVIEKSLEFFILKKSDKHNIFTYIESCILKETSNVKFSDGLDKIKHGLILYESISCGINDINPSKWSEKIIFLDTEILFYLASYNGKLFEKISQDFLNLIKIVNKKKTIIKLKFFEDTKKELDCFFDVAESIIRKEKPKKPNDVINYILKKCQSSSDVVAMKADFYIELSKQGVKEYTHQVNYDNQDNYQYNLEHDSDLSDKEKKHLRQLSHINILRHGNKYKTLDKVKYLFLTETIDTIKQSSKNRGSEDFSLALSLFDLTNQLWIKTNKGLGDGDLPATFNIRNQARIALSSSLAKGVSEEYDKISQQHKDKHISKQEYIDKIADLREKEILPDDINELNCEDITDLILDPESIERHYEEKSYHKEESERKSLELERKSQKIKEKNEKIEGLEKRDIVRKSRNKKIVKIIISLIAICSLFYFKSEIINTIQWNSDLYDLISVLAFFGIQAKEIKLYLVKRFKK